MVLDDVERSELWWLFGGILSAAVLYVVYSFVGTFVFGIFLYYATRPIYRRLRRRIYPPSLAAAVALFALALPALLLAGYAVTIVIREVTRYVNNGGDDIAERLGLDPEFVARIADPAAVRSFDFAQYLSADRISALVGSLGTAADTLAVVGIAAIHLFVMIAIAFYLLRDDHRLARWVYTRFDDDQGVLQQYLKAVDRDFHSIFFGNILNALLTGTIGVISFSLLNTLAPPGVRIPAPALVGLLAGVASLVPVVGMKLVYFPVAGLMAIRVVAEGAGSPGLSFVVLFAAVSFVIVDTIPDLVLRPYVSGRSLHVGAVMIAYTFGPLLFGWYGIFLMPMLLVLVVQFARVVLPRLMSPEPLRPYAVDPTHFTTPKPNASAPTGDVAAGEAESPDPPTDGTDEKRREP